MQQNRYSDAKRVTLIGALVNALLGIFKILGGMFFHSHALLADGFHSFSDLITDGMVVFASKYGSQEADDSHPYGHQRIETAATLMLALLLVLAGLSIAWHACNDLIGSLYSMPDLPALPIAILSTLANEGLFQYTKRVGERIKSDLIIANAWHHRSDAASSLVVIFGLLGSIAGYAYLDALAAVIVGLMIVQMGIDYGWNSVKELVDTAVDPSMTALIESKILKVDGVHKIHQLRSRKMGRDIFIDVHIQVSPHISVSEGHYVAQHVHNGLVNLFEHVQDVTVHVDPEDDETCSPSYSLPNRSSLEHSFLNRWQKDYPGIQEYILHYLDGAITIDIVCETTFNDWRPLLKRIQTDLKSQTEITHISLCVQQDEIKLAK